MTNNGLGELVAHKILDCGCETGTEENDHSEHRYLFSHNHAECEFPEHKQNCPECTPPDAYTWKAE